MTSEIYENLLNRVISLSIALDHERNARMVAESKACEKPVIDSRPAAVDLIAFMVGDRKIEAIKAYRTLTGDGLLESKNAVESVMNRMKVKS